MGKQTTYVKTVNNYDIYKLNKPIAGLKAYTIANESKIVVNSTDTLVQAETWANAN